MNGIYVFQIYLALISMSNDVNFNAEVTNWLCGAHIYNFSNMMTLFYYFDNQWDINMQRNGDMFYFAGPGWGEFCEENEFEILDYFTFESHLNEHVL